MLGYGRYDIYDFGVVVKLDTLLRVVAEANGRANINSAFVGHFEPEQHLYKGRFAGAVVADDTDFVVSLEGVFKTL